MKYRQNPIYITMLFISIIIVTACSQKPPEKREEVPDNSMTMLKIATGQIEHKHMQPGLTVTYYLKFFKRSVKYLRQMKEGEFSAIQGEPILQLNHQFGDRDVFDSGTSRGVAMHMKGYFFFPEPGRYEMQALSNDGVIVTLADQPIISDPRQHSDQLSDIASFHIEQKGWAPISVEFFQRKGTSALKLYWKTPAGKEFIPAPKSSFGHLKQ